MNPSKANQNYSDQTIDRIIDFFIMSKKMSRLQWTTLRI
ncbi:hypothetical protein [Paenibacillus polysaccharolyticus]